MITDAELSALGLTSGQITAFKTALDSGLSEPTFSLVLRQYAPEWYSHSAPYSVAKSMFSAGVDAATVVTCAPDGTSWSVKTLASEDSGDQSWVTTYTEPGTVPIRDMSYQSSTFWFINNSDGKLYPPAGGQTVAGIATLKKVAGVTGTRVHVIGTTTQGNWKLAYVYLDAAWYQVESEIYWPFQVRSFDAVRMNGYDIIAMITDLPPLVDYTTNGKKLVKTEQRVQGIVLFKFDYTLMQWSDAWTFDVADNHSDVVRAHVKLTKNGSEVFMTYAKEYGGKVGLAITKSSDGIDWENPIFYTDIGNKTHVSDCYPMAIDRNGKYLYLVSGNDVRRSIATDFMGTADSSATQDVTKYVTSLSGQHGQSRSVTVELANPENVLMSSAPLSKLPIGIKADLDLGYYTSSGWVTLPIMNGIVTEYSHDIGLPVRHLSLDIKDAGSLVSLVGTPEAQEWWGPRFGGDNFVPTITDDELGTSGLGHVAIHEGTWMGGNSTLYNQGLSMKCNNQEGRVFSTFLSRAMCGWASAELSFYKAMSALDFSGGTPTEGLSSAKSEYAGIFFRAANDHNMWWVRYRPGGATANYNYFDLMKRVGTMVQSDGTDGHEKGEWYESHTDTQIASTLYSLDRGASPTYSKWYSGRLTAEWRYSLMRCYRREPGGTPAKIFEYEIPGIGDNDFNNPPGGFYRGMTAGAMGYLAFSPKDGYLNISPNGTGESDYTPPLDYWTTQSGGTVSSETSPLRPGSTVTRVIKVTTGTETGNNPGAIYDTGTGLGISAGTELKFDCWIMVTDGDHVENGAQFQVRCRAKLWYSDASSEKTSWNVLTALNEWTHYAWTATTATGKTVDRIEVFFNDGRAPADISTTTTFYVSEFSIGKRTTDSFVYVGNVDCSEITPAYTVSDAVKALLAYSGQHYTHRRMLVDDHFTSDTGMWIKSSMALTGSEIYGQGYAYTKFTVPLPYIAEFTILSSEGQLMLRTGASATAYFEWRTTYAEIYVYDNSMGGSFTRRLPLASALASGSVIRVLATTGNAEGILARKADATGQMDWMTIVVYVNGRFLMAGTSPYYAITNFGSKVGFQKAGTNDIRIDRVQIEQLHRNVPFFSIDPNENVSSGLGRLVGSSRMVLLSRYDDSALIGRKTDATQNIGVYSANTITFYANVGTSNKEFRIVDSANGLGVFVAGDLVAATGSTTPENNRVFTVLSVHTGGDYMVVKEWVVTTYDSPTITLTDISIPAVTSTRIIKQGEQGSLLTPTHVRLIGAWDEDDVFDQVAMQRIWRHTFTSKNDPNLITADEMAVEESYLLTDLDAAKQREAIQTKFDPRLEYGDLVVYNNALWQLDALSWSLNRSSAAPILSAQLTLNEV